MSLAVHVRTLGRGPGRARSLTVEEAQDAMGVMLSGNAKPEAIGALLMLLRMKGEVAAEIAGFTAAAQAHISLDLDVDLDWPSYAAGRTRGLPWFLLSARLVAMAGHRVLLHGWNGADAEVRKGLAPAGIGTAQSAAEAEKLLARDRIAYVPLETLSPAVFDLLKLRDVLGLRSCINTVSRMLNPARAAASVQGVFHPSYRMLQADAAQLLGWQSLCVIKGGGGEFERHPGKAIAGFGVRAGEAWQDTLPPLLDQTRRLGDGPTDPAQLSNMWNGRDDDPFARAVILGTAALALDTLGVANAPARAQDLWSRRLSTLAA